MTKSRLSKRGQADSFAEYVKQHGEEEAVPFDDVLRRLVKRKPQHDKGVGSKRRK